MTACARRGADIALVVLACVASSSAQDRRDLGGGEARVVAQSFRAAVAARDSLWSLRRIEGDIASAVLRPELPGVGPEAIDIPFSNAPRRVRVLVGAEARMTLVVVGGVRTKLTILCFRDGRRCTMEFAGARLIAGFERPLLDSGGDALLLLYRDDAGVQLRACGTRHARPRHLLARCLKRVPELLTASLLDGDPRVQVRIGDVAALAPGAREATEGPGTALQFLHPLAALPRPSTIALDFGALERGRFGSRPLEIANPGAFDVRVSFRARFADESVVRVKPSDVRVPARGKVRVVVEMQLDPARERSSGSLEILGLLVDRGRLADCALSARRAQDPDTKPPVLDRAKIETTLLPGRRARILAVAGALVDASPPCRVSHVSGASVEVAADGAFSLEIPLGVGGRVRVRARDARGNLSEPLDLGALRDRSPPSVDRSKISIGLPVRGRVVLRGEPGAISDDTPPLRVRAKIQPGAREALILVRPDGSFRQQIAAPPGARISIVAQDGAAPLNRGREIRLGRVMPFLTRVGRDLRLHAPAYAKLRAEVLAGQLEGEPAPVLRVLQGVMDPGASLRIGRTLLEGGVRLRVEIELAGGRPLQATLPLR